MYDRMIESGILGEDDPIELLAGRLVVAEPKHSPHETAVHAVADALRAAFGQGWHVRIGAPLVLGDFSEPEPDVSVVRGSFRDYRDAHPSQAALIVEVAQTSLRLDRRIKASIYAAGGIAEYWIVNLVAGVLEVHREPVATTRRRWEYARITTLAREARVTPLAAPSSAIHVDDLLP
ncbi:MAG: Uma2 family endonuclease [Candidatus Rokuibacteriota bacterium]